MQHFNSNDHFSTLEQNIFSYFTQQCHFQRGGHSLIKHSLSNATALGVAVLNVIRFRGSNPDPLIFVQ